MDYLYRAKKFRTKKRLGQNFLIDENIINTIIDEANIGPEDTVVEIGGGAGFVTEKLAEKAKKVVVVELDDEAVQVLKKLKLPNLEVIHQDILKTSFSEITDTPVKIVANIPYYITSPIVTHLIEEKAFIKDIILMVQLEVAKRLVADETSKAKEYGQLSIYVNNWCTTEFLCKVPADSFYPAPKVDSALVRLTMRSKPAVEIENPELFREVVQAAFGMRRKTVRNALIKHGFEVEKVDSALKSVNIEASRRGETLSIEDFKNLSEKLYKK